MNDPKPADAGTELPGKRYAASPDVVIERLGDSMVTVQLGTDRILELNETASRLVELLQAGNSDAEAASLLAKEYDVPLAEVAANVRLTVAQLLEEKVLEPAGS
ncbi:MAG TPA: PqqD family protein [Trueperaceae bacterium]|nr:PqqD family protein [Trueperaceae bacterium]